MNLRKLEDSIIPIYENERKEKLVNARELFYLLRGNKTKTKFSDWIKQRIKQYEFVESVEFIKIRNFTKVGNLSRPQDDYYITIDMSKELCMIENNGQGKRIRRYFIEVEKRYRNILVSSNDTNQLIDLMQNAINYMKENNIRVDNLEPGLIEVKKEVEELKLKNDIKIQNNYCLASDIAEQLHLYSENKIPHANLIGAIARQLGYKISYKHYYEDEYIAIVKDASKYEYWQVYFKPKAVNEMIKWFHKNKKEIYYEIQYVRNTENGKTGEIKEKGYKIDNIGYKIYDLGGKNEI